jgi:hypothetical protein
MLSVRVFFLFGKMYRERARVVIFSRRVAENAKCCALSVRAESRTWEALVIPGLPEESYLAENAERYAGVSSGEAGNSGRI